MVIRRIFGRKKKDEDEEETTETEEVVVEEAPTEPVEVEEEAPVVEEVAAAPTGTMPYHDTFPDRLTFMFGSEMGSGVEAPDEFKLEFMAMGERFHIHKDSMGDVMLHTGTISDEDVFIRIGDDVVRELLSAANFQEFSEIYMRYYKTPEPGKFVKIEIRKDVSNLNRRGYARVPLLKLLIGAAR